MNLTEYLENQNAEALKTRCKRIPNTSRVTRKADLVATIRSYLLSENLTTIVAELADLERSAVAEAVHNLAAFRKRLARLGFVLPDITP